MRITAFRLAQPDGLRVILWLLIVLSVTTSCTGRSDVTTGPDQAENLPPMPGATPQQFPTPSALPSQTGHAPRPAATTSATSQPGTQRSH